jgi:formamidopyrimidine-DNA glycosylase
MPELPDITNYVEAIAARAKGSRLSRVRLANPFLLRTAFPPIEEANGRRLASVGRIGKRIVFELEGERFLVLHLMIAGRLHWVGPGEKLPARRGRAIAWFDFDAGSLVLTEAGTKRRASLHFVAGRGALHDFDMGGVEPLECDFAAFDAALRRENHTVKRALTDPHIFSGIGNAYSDEILHKAKLSPLALTQKMSEADARRLFDASRAILTLWIARLREESAGAFPEKVTAFREGMAVHGRYKKPCPDCGSPIQRIRYADNETNYCVRCQTGGKLLADRSLSQVLRGDWPKTLEELESRRRERRAN